MQLNEDQTPTGENRTSAGRPRLPPKFLHYLVLNLAVWVFLAFQAWILILALGSSRLIYLVTLLLGAGFFLASMFDYLWLRIRSGRKNETA